MTIEELTLTVEILAPYDLYELQKQDYGNFLVEILEKINTKLELEKQGFLE